MFFGRKFLCILICVYICRRNRKHKMKLDDMKRLFLAIVCLGCLLNFCRAEEYQVKSPNGKLIVRVDVAEQVRYSLWHEGEQVLNYSPISLSLEGQNPLGIQAKIKDVYMREINQQIVAQFYKRKQMKDHCNEMVLAFKEGFQLHFRAYDEGMAYRR